MNSIETPDVESSSSSYADRFSGEVGKYFLGVQLSAVSRFVGDPNGKKILDVGGGHAQLTPFLVSEGARMTVFGSNEHGRQLLDKELDNESYTYVSGNLLSLPFEDNAFDTVLAIRLLPHLIAWDKFVLELCRVAKTAVVVDYPDKRSVNYFSDLLFSAKKAIEKDTRTYQCFSSRQIESSFSKAGFSAAGSYRQFALPMALHRAIGRRSYTALVESIANRTGLRQMFGSPVIHKFVVTK